MEMRPVWGEIWCRSFRLASFPFIMRAARWKFPPPLLAWDGRRRGSAAGLGPECVAAGFSGGRAGDRMSGSRKSWGVTLPGSRKASVARLRPAKKKKPGLDSVRREASRVGPRPPLLVPSPATVPMNLSLYLIRVKGSGPVSLFA